MGQFFQLIHYFSQSSLSSGSIGNRGTTYFNGFNGIFTRTQSNELSSEAISSEVQCLTGTKTIDYFRRIVSQVSLQYHLVSFTYDGFRGFHLFGNIVSVDYDFIGLFREESSTDYFGVTLLFSNGFVFHEFRIDLTADFIRIKRQEVVFTQIEVVCSKHVVKETTQQSRNITQFGRIDTGQVVFAFYTFVGSLYSIGKRTQYVSKEFHLVDDFAVRMSENQLTSHVEFRRQGYLSKLVFRCQYGYQFIGVIDVGFFNFHIEVVLIQMFSMQIRVEQLIGLQDFAVYFIANSRSRLSNTDFFQEVQTIELVGNDFVFTALFYRQASQFNLVGQGFLNGYLDRGVNVTTTDVFVDSRYGTKGYFIQVSTGISGTDQQVT